MRIKVKGDEYRRSNGQFWCDETEMYLIDNCTSIYELNYEVEIIEEDKKIETLDLDWAEVFNFKGQAQQDCVKMVFNKINEIIDKLNEMEKE